MRRKIYLLIWAFILVMPFLILELMYDYWVWPPNIDRCLACKNNLQVRVRENDVVLECLACGWTSRAWYQQYRWQMDLWYAEQAPVLALILLIVVGSWLGLSLPWFKKGQKN